jgi:hypothetical protein
MKILIFNTLQYMLKWVKLPLDCISYNVKSRENNTGLVG